MRAVSSATCTSGEPVSPSWEANLRITSVLASLVGSRRRKVAAPDGLAGPAAISRVCSTSALICSTSSSAESNLHLVAQPLEEREPSGLPVEVALEADQVGLDPQVALVLECRAHADADRGRDLAAAVDRARSPRRCRPAGRTRPVRGAMLPSACRARGRARRRARPRPRAVRGRRAARRRARTSPAATSSLIRLEETGAPPCSTSGTTVGLELRPRAQQRRRRRAPDGRSGSSRPRSPGRAPSTPTSTSAQKSSADLPRQLLRERDREQLVHASSATSSAFVAVVGEQRRRVVGPQHPQRMRVEGDDGRAQPAFACTLDGGADHPPVAAVHAVEGAERDGAAAGAGGNIRERPVDVHRPRGPASPNQRGAPGTWPSRCTRRALRTKRRQIDAAARGDRLPALEGVVGPEGHLPAAGALRHLGPEQRVAPAAAYLAGRRS